MPITPKAIQDLLDELEASRASRKRAWEVLQEIRGVLEDTAGVTVSPPFKKTIDLEGKVVKDAVRKALQERQTALTGLMHAIREYRKLADQPFTLRGTVMPRQFRSSTRRLGALMRFYSEGLTVNDRGPRR